MFHVGKFFAFSPTRFELRTLGFLVGALTTDLHCRGAAWKKVKLDPVAMKEIYNKAASLVPTKVPKQIDIRNAFKMQVCA